jgi:hypothetical protein
MLNDFDEIFGSIAPTNGKLVEFLRYLNDLMWADDVDSMNAVLNKPTKETNKLMMVSVLRGLYAYRRRHSLPEWEKAVVRIRDWLDELGMKTDSILGGIIDKQTREPYVNEVKDE